MAEPGSIREEIKSAFGAQTSEAGWGLLILAGFVHLCDAFLRLPGGRIDFYMWTIFFVAYAIVGVMAAQRLKTWKGPIITSMIAAFAIPIVYAFAAKAAIVLGLVVILAPTWIIYLLVIRGEKYYLPLFPIPIRIELGTAYLIFWIILVAFSFMPTVQNYAAAEGYDLPVVSPAIVLRYTIDKLSTGFVNAWHAITVTGPEKVRKEIERGYEIATGDYYTGSIDESAEKRLGVFLENLRPAQSSFKEGEPVTVFAILKAETIDKPIEINLDCRVEPGNIKYSDLIPKQQFTVETFEEEGIDCIFQNLPAKYYTAKLTADFSFSTRSYQKVYFMDKERLREYKRRYADPLEGYPDKNPTTQYSPGPLMVGMGIGTQPVGITAESRGPTIGVTVDNTWAGQLKEIRDLFMIVPKGLTVNDINGIPVNATTCATLHEKDQVGCDDNLENVYRLPYSEMQKLANITVYTFRAHTSINSTEDYSKLVGDTPVAIKNIKVTLDYAYKYIASVGLNVAKNHETNNYLNIHNNSHN
jgi:hypothetical protein